MSKKSFKNPADDFLSVKPQNIDNTDANINNNRKHIKNSNINSISLSNIFDNIQDNKIDGATRSFYLSNKIFNALVKKAKAKNMSNSKFLEGILSQLFFDDN